MVPLSDRDFAEVQRFIFASAGISLSPGKKALVGGRLAKRVQARGLASYAEYIALMTSSRDPAEMQLAVDLLTTNETYFFREPKHFELLRKLAAAAPAAPFRVWSAASSSGEEGYSAAMVLADCRGARPFEVIGTDISTRMVERARRGVYSMQRANLMPPGYLERFCLKGHGDWTGMLLVDPHLRRHVRYLHANLNEKLPVLGTFDLVFLRNVMIYFNNETKRQVVARILAALKPGGYLLIGHSETLNGISNVAEQISPSIYRKPTAVH